MHMIVAIFQPQQFPAVKRALIEAQVHHITCTNILGTAPERSEHTTYRGVDRELSLFQKVRVEIAVNDEFLERTVDALVEGGVSSGGAGKIFVLPLENVVSVKTGEQGPRAV